MNSSERSQKGDRLKLVWDTCALVNIKEPNEQGYSPAESLLKDLFSGIIPGPYLNIFPAISLFELQATFERKRRGNTPLNPELFVLNEHSKVYVIDEELMRKSASFVAGKGFRELRGADLIFACIAKLEDAYLVTLDKDMAKAMENEIKLLDLNGSRDEANYRTAFLSSDQLDQVPQKVPAHFGFTSLSG